MRTKLKQIIQGMVLFFYGLLRVMLPLNRKIILFESNLGRNYTGNPRAIYEEMVRQGLDKKYRCYFILEDPNTKLTGAAQPVKRSRLRYFVLFAVAGTWICDTRLPKYIVKRKGVKYIQTWHGTPLKKLALDMDSVVMAGEDNIEIYKKYFYENTQTWDYLISQNKFSTEIFRRAFAFQKDMLEIGYPRNDVLFHKNNQKDILAIKEEMGLPLDKKVVLYAPTWRDHEFHGKGKYKFSSSMDFNSMQQRLGEDTVLIVKYHYLVMDQIDWTPYHGFVYSYDMSYDISLLYLVSDMLITDYSSVMFDYSLLKRPMLFYCYDLDHYKDNLRGFYFDFLEEAPGPVVITTDDLIDEIKGYDGSIYEAKYKAFNEKYNHADDGTASKQIVSLIEAFR